MTGHALVFDSFERCNRANTSDFPLETNGIIFREELSLLARHGGQETLTVPAISIDSFGF